MKFVSTIISVLLKSVFLILLLVEGVSAANDRTLVIGTEAEYPPFSFEKNGEIKGHNADILQAIAHATGSAFDLQVGPWASIRSRLEEGSIDAVVGMYYSRERDEKVDFTTPFYLVHHSAFKRKGEPELQTEEDLAGKRLIVMEDDIMHDYLLEHYPDAFLIPVESIPEALKTLQRGEGDYAVLAKVCALFWMKEMNFRALEPTGPLLRLSRYCLAVREGDHELLALLNEGLALIETNGEKRRIEEKWFADLAGVGMSRERLFFWSMVVVGPLLLISGLSVAMVIVLRKIIRLRTREIRASEEKYRTTLSSIGDAVITTDQVGRVMLMNPVAEELTEWEAEDARGRDLEEVFHIVNAFSGKRVESPSRKVIESGFTVGLANHTKIIGRKGAEHHIADAASPILDDDGKITGVVLIFRDVSEEYRLQRAVSENEKQLRTLYESMTEGLCIHELVYDDAGEPVNYRIIGINPAYESILGLKSEHVVGKLATEVYGSDEPPFFEKYRQVALTLQPDRFEVDYPPLAKSFMISVFSPGKGKFVTVFTDVTRQQKLEKEVRYHLDRYRGLFSSLNDAVFVHPWAEEGFRPFVEVNQVACDRYGYSREEFLKLTAADITSSEDVSGHGMKEHRSRLRDRRHLVFETVHLTKSGRRIPVEISANIVDMDGVPTIVALARDVSERINREKRLRRINLILRSIREVNLLIARENDRESLIFGAARILVETTGYRHCWIHLAEEEEHKACFAGFPEEKFIGFDEWKEELEHLKCIRMAESTGSVARVQCPQKECPGCRFSETYSSSRSVALPLKFGVKSYGFLSVAMDPENVDEQMEEESLLEEVAKDISYALHNLDAKERDRQSRAALIRAKVEAESANKAKNEFLAVMSHEMRTPLNPITGYASLMLEDEPSETHRKYLEAILESAERELAMINDILDYIRLDRKHVRAKFVEFDLIELCHSAIADVENLNPALEIRFVPGNVPAAVFVRGERHMILQILDNLLTNACKYTPEGTVELKLEQREVEGQTYFEFCVTDTGIGIDPGNLARIFEPFTQIDSSHTREYEGVGLGLAICRKLTEYLKGTLEVESARGQGSSFLLSLPLECLESFSAQLQSRAEEVAKPVMFADRRVLIVEDREDNLTITRDMLKRMGVQSDLARNGTQAVELASKAHYDAILMDLAMPVMNGFLASETIRNGDNPNRKTPIIALTADVSAGVETRCREAGMDAYLSKPVYPNLLNQQLESVWRVHG